MILSFTINAKDILVIEFAKSPWIKIRISHLPIFSPIVVRFGLLEKPEIEYPKFNTFNAFYASVGIASLGFIFNKKTRF